MNRVNYRAPEYLAESAERITNPQTPEEWRQLLIEEWLSLKVRILISLMLSVGFWLRCLCQTFQRNGGKNESFRINCWNAW